MTPIPSLLDAQIRSQCAHSSPIPTPRRPTIDPSSSLVHFGALGCHSPRRQSAFVHHPDKHTEKAHVCVRAISTRAVEIQTASCAPVNSPPPFHCTCPWVPVCPPFAHYCLDAGSTTTVRADNGSRYRAPRHTPGPSHEHRQSMRLHPRLCHGRRPLVPECRCRGWCSLFCWICISDAEH